MAREHARILCAIWNDKDFKQRTPGEQRLYMLLLSQKTINNAGVLPLQPAKWARGSVATTVDDVLTDLKGLAEHRYVVVDDETEEVLVRSFIRNDGIVKIPNVLKSALKQAVQVESPRLRLVLAGELRRLGLSTADRVADELDPNGSRTVPEPVANDSTKGQSSVDNPPKSVDNSKGSRKGSRRDTETPGGGVGEGKGESPSVGGSVGEARPSARNEPPPPKCSEHINGDTDRPCRACGEARRARERWDADQAAAVAALTRELGAARRNGALRCEHGTDGGLHRRSDTGELLCANCRRVEQTAREPA